MSLITAEKEKLNELQKKLDALEAKDEETKDLIFEKETKMQVLKKVIETGPNSEIGSQLLQEIGREQPLDSLNGTSYASRQMSNPGTGKASMKPSPSSKGNGFMSSVIKGDTVKSETFKAEASSSKYNFLKPVPVEMQFTV